MDGNILRIDGERFQFENGKLKAELWLGYNHASPSECETVSGCQEQAIAFARSMEFAEGAFEN